MKIKCKEFVFFKNELRDIIAISIDCAMFKKTFYSDIDIDWVAGSFHDEETNLEKIEVVFKNDDNEKRIFISNKDDIDWVELKTYKHQIKEYLTS